MISNSIERKEKVYKNHQSRTLLNIYADDITFYRCNSKNREEQSLADDLSPDLLIKSQWEKTSL